MILSDLGLRRLLSEWIYMLGFAKMHLGRYQEARAHAQSTLALAREFGSPAGLAVSHCTLGCVALVKGAYVEAHRLGQQNLAINRERKRPGFLAESLANMAYATRALGNHRQAERYLYKAVQIAIEIQAIYPLLFALPAIALLQADQGEPERAVELYALASRYPQVANSRWFEDVVGRADCRGRGHAAARGAGRRARTRSGAGSADHGGRVAGRTRPAGKLTRARQPKILGGQSPASE